jgi:2-dehydropantoate 2-reductase
MLTLATIDRVVTEPSIRTLCRSIMTEAAEVAEALGIRIPRSMIERRLDAATAMVGHKMSMLQDLERGRDLKLDAIVEAVQEVGPPSRCTNSNPGYSAFPCSGPNSALASMIGV